MVSVLAAFLAICTIAGNRSSTEAILAAGKASDTYNEYQANSLKRHINTDDAALLRLLTANGPQAAAGEQQAKALDDAVATKYQPTQDELLPQAQAYERERDAAEERHRTFELAEAAFQLGIVCSSIAIVARAAGLLVAGAGLGLAGLVLAADGFLGWIQIP